MDRFGPGPSENPRIGMHGILKPSTGCIGIAEIYLEEILMDFEIDLF